MRRDLHHFSLSPRSGFEDSGVCVSVDRRIRDRFLLQNEIRVCRVPGLVPTVSREVGTRQQLVPKINKGLHESEGFVWGSKRKRGMTSWSSRHWHKIESCVNSRPNPEQLVFLSKPSIGASSAFIFFSLSLDPCLTSRLHQRLILTRGSRRERAFYSKKFLVMLRCVAGMRWH